jgi:hypothetical protein
MYLINPSSIKEMLFQVNTSINEVQEHSTRGDCLDVGNQHQQIPHTYYVFDRGNSNVSHLVTDRTERRRKHTRVFI